MAQKPKFDPNKPFEVVSAAPAVAPEIQAKPPFDPNKPFEAVAEADDSLGESEDSPLDLPTIGARKLGAAAADPKSTLGQMVNYGARALDYGGGVIRTGLAGVGGLLSGQPDVVTTEDLKKAAIGKAPTSAQYMERLNVPEGPSVTLPVAGKISARDVGGFVGDIATDPLTLGSKAAQKIPAVARAVEKVPGLSKAANVASEATEKAGENVYKSAFKKIDERLEEKGKGSLGELLIKEGAPVGSTKEISKEAEKIADAALKERGELYKKAADLGVTIDLGHPLKNTEKVLSELAENPRLEEKVLELEKELVTPFKKKGKVSLEQLSNWKTRLYESLPASAFGPDGKVVGPYKIIDEALAKDFKELIIEGGNKAEKGLGDRIDTVNEKIGTVLTSQKPTQMQIRREITPNAVTSVDAVLGMLSPSALPLKKAADISKTAAARTRLGKGLMKTGQSGLVDPFARRGLIDIGKGFLEPEQ